LLPANPVNLSPSGVRRIPTKILPLRRRQALTWPRPGDAGPFPTPKLQNPDWDRLQPLS